MVEQRQVAFEVDGFEILGEIYLPGGEAVSLPALCICHGIPAGHFTPGDEGYPGLARRFSEAGFATLIFNFRGAGKSQGNIDMLGWSRDLKVAIDFLSNFPGVDKNRLSLMGFSAGAAISIYFAANDSRVSSVVACACPADFSVLLSVGVSKVIERFRTIGIIKDPAFPSSLDEWLEGFKTVSPINWVDRISPRPLLIVHGEEDESVPLTHARALYERAKEPKELAIIPGGKHKLRLEERAITQALTWLKAIH